MKLVDFIKKYTTVKNEFVDTFCLFTRLKRNNTIS